MVDSDDTMVVPSSSPLKPVSSPTALLADNPSASSTLLGSTTAFQYNEESESGDITVQTNWSCEHYKAVKESVAQYDAETTMNVVGWDGD
ncbi:hypothetical protein DL96DRAFT_1705500 [Flagelloscypha sp. PMI_526]|nr:hypothetical protein DL96DRAFT_1705500 [Flagelloscypha sp. PMI_526]